MIKTIVLASVLAATSLSLVAVGTAQADPMMSHHMTMKQRMMMKHDMMMKRRMAMKHDMMMKRRMAMKHQMMKHDM